MSDCPTSFGNTDISYMRLVHVAWRRVMGGGDFEEVLIDHVSQRTSQVFDDNVTQQPPNSCFSTCSR